MPAQSLEFAIFHAHKVNTFWAASSRILCHNSEVENTQAAASAAASKLMLRFAGCASEFVAHSADSAAFSLRFATLRQQQAAGQVGRAVRQAGRERSLQSQSILSIRRTGMHWTFFVVSLTRSFLQHNSSNSTTHRPTPRTAASGSVLRSYAAPRRLIRLRQN